MLRNLLNAFEKGEGVYEDSDRGKHNAGSLVPNVELSQRLCVCESLWMGHSLK